jgi:hypothetical protein
MSFTVVQTAVGNATGASSSPVTASFGSAVTAGNIIVIIPQAIVQTNAPGLTWSAVGDNKSNSYTQEYTHNISASSGGQWDTIDFWLALATTGGTGVTVTATPSTSANLDLFALEISYSGLTPIFVGSNQQGAASPGTSLSTGNITVAGNGLVIAVGNSFQLGNLTVGGGYTQAGVITGVSGVCQGLCQYLANTSTTPAAPTMTNGGSSPWFMAGFSLEEVAGPTMATLAGPSPSSGLVGQQSGAFSVTLDVQAPFGGITVNLSSNGSGDTFQAVVSGSNVTTVTIPAGQTSVNFYLTPGTTGTRHVSITTTPTLTIAGSPVTYTSNSNTATSYTFSGPSGGIVNVVSGTFTVTLNGVPPGGNCVVTITPSGGGLTNPIPLTFSGSTTVQTFTIDPSALDTVNLTPTNNGGLADPSLLHYTVSSAPTTWTKASTANGFNGNLSTVGYTVYAHDNSVYAARTTSGVTENPVGSGIYGADVTLPFSGRYRIVWDDGQSPITTYAPDTVSPLVVETTGLNLAQAISVILAAAAGKVSGLQFLADGSPVFVAPDGATPRLSGTNDVAGNRDSSVLTPPT